MNNKKTITLFMIVFMLPLLLAYGVLNWQWLPTTRLNNGQFVEPEVTLRHWSTIKPKPWSIAILGNSPCDKNCALQRHQLRNLHLALGKNRDKVDLVLINYSAQPVEKFKEYPFSQTQQQLVSAQR